MADDIEAVTLKGDEILQKLQRDINCLNDDNKITRRRAIEKIKNEISATPPDVLHYILDKSLIKQILKLFSDPMEKCRELSINTINQTVSADSTHFLPLIIPIIVARLGTVHITEPSEEIRLLLVQLLVKLLSTCGCGFSPYVHDMIAILRYTLMDQYHEVKKESCTCVIKLSSCVPSHLFSQESEFIVKSLLTSCLSHQHSKVRIASIKALGNTILYGTANCINDCLSILAQRVCDNNSTVRLTVINTLGNWLLELPDRYSYHYKLIPLLLTGLHDEVTEIKETVHKLWTQIGVKYEQENENDLKDKMDFANIKEPFPLLVFPRPSLGCRVLVYRNFSKILPAILCDLSDWTVHNRLKSSQLLYTLLYHLEEYITQSIQPILGGVYKSCQDEQYDIIKWACQSAQVIGYYVPVEIWCHLVLPAVRTSGGVSGGVASSVPVGPVQCTSCLMTLNNLIIGGDSLITDTQLQDITLCIGEPVLVQTSNINLMEQLLYCVSSIIKVSNDVTALSLHLFIILLRLYTSLSALVPDIITNLARKQNITDIPLLYTQHSIPIMNIIKDDYINWGIMSPNYLLFSNYITHCNNIPDSIINDVITIITHYTVTNEQDTELRFKFITLLIQCVISNQSSLNSSCVAVIIKDIIIPCCIWKAGRTSAAIRTAALTGAQLLLNIITTTGTDNDRLLVQELLPQVLSCLDDDNYSTRHVSCKVLTKLLSITTFTVDGLHELYPHIFKRLDDSCNDIRTVIASNTLVTYFNSFPINNYDVHLYKAHIELIYTTLLIHLDDPCSDIQENILNVLKISSKLNDSLLIEMTQNVKGKHRTTKYCDELIEYIIQSRS